MGEEEGVWKVENVGVVVVVVVDEVFFEAFEEQV